MPVTVAGPHRHSTGFRVSRPLSSCAANLDRDFLVGKHRGELRLEGIATRLIRGALRLGRRVVARERLIQIGDGAREVSGIGGTDTSTDATKPPRR